MQTSDWRIESLTVENFRAYREFTVGFSPNLTVLVGLNGEGKTSVLDALAISLGPVLAGFGEQTPGFDRKDARLTSHDLASKSAVATMEQNYPVRSHLTATINGKQLTWTRERSSARGRTTGGNSIRNRAHKLAEAATTGGNTPIVLPALAYYGIERLVGVRRNQGTISTSRLGAYAAAFDTKSDLARLGTYIEALSTQAAIDISRNKEVSGPIAGQLQAIEEACERALGPISWHRPTWNALVNTITLESKTTGDVLPLDWLSSGLRITAGLVIDLASRMARANPHLVGTELLDTVPGIVLIDEVDLHLHPQWQQHIIGSLRATFPRVQFIVTTHSPQVISTVPSECVRVLHGPQVSTPEFSEGLRSDIVLRAVQNTSPTPTTENRKLLDQYMTLVEAGEGESAKAKELRNRLDESMGGVSLVPELAEADAYMTIFGGD